MKNDSMVSESEVTLGDKLEWYAKEQRMLRIAKGCVAIGGRVVLADVERQYAAAHPPVWTAESVWQEFRGVADPQCPQDRLKHHPPSVGNLCREVADHRNAAQQDGVDQLREELVQGKTRVSDRDNRIARQTAELRKLDKMVEGLRNALAKANSATARDEQQRVYAVIAQRSRRHAIQASEEADDSHARAIAGARAAECHALLGHIQGGRSAREAMDEAVQDALHARARSGVACSGTCGSRLTLWWCRQSPECGAGEADEAWIGEAADHLASHDCPASLTVGSWMRRIIGAAYDKRGES